MNTARVRVVVEGLVQGVWYRASCKKMAQEIGLRGWVRNLPGGKVEAVFEGDRDKLKEAVSWCCKGPPGARVDHCDSLWEPPAGEKIFEIRY